MTLYALPHIDEVKMSLPMGVLFTGVHYTQPPIPSFLLIKGAYDSASSPDADERTAGLQVHRTILYPVRMRPLPYPCPISSCPINPNGYFSLGRLPLRPVKPFPLAPSPSTLL